jgi:hypothetical protein
MAREIGRPQQVRDPLVNARANERQRRSSESARGRDPERFGAPRRLWLPRVPGTGRHPLPSRSWRPDSSGAAQKKGPARKPARIVGRGCLKGIVGMTHTVARRKKVCASQHCFTTKVGLSPRSAASAWPGSATPRRLWRCRAQHSLSGRSSRQVGLQQPIDISDHCIRELAVSAIDMPISGIAEQFFSFQATPPKCGAGVRIALSQASALASESRSADIIESIVQRR